MKAIEERKLDEIIDIMKSLKDIKDEEIKNKIKN